MKMSEYMELAREAAERYWMNYHLLAAAILSLNVRFDAARTPIADAAQTLWALTGGLTQGMLKSAAHGEIIALAKTAKPFADYIAEMVAPPIPRIIPAFGLRSRIGAYWLAMGSGPFAELPSERLSVAASYTIKVPIKEQCSKCADAAEFLYLQVGVTQPVLIHTDRQTILATYKSMPKTKVRIVVSNVGIPEEGGKITFDFFKGRDFVYSHVLSGKTISQYERTIVVPGVYDAVRIEDTHKARKITVERV